VFQIARILMAIGLLAALCGAAPFFLGASWGVLANIKCARCSPTPAALPNRTLHHACLLVGTQQWNECGLHLSQPPSGLRKGKQVVAGACMHAAWLICVRLNGQDLLLAQEGAGQRRRCHPC
jgi:hypothetical protein